MDIDDRFIYGRTAHFADCGTLRMRPAVLALCPRQPLDQRPERAHWFIWNRNSPIHNATATRRCCASLLST
jgi:hypothetical protein